MKLFVLVVLKNTWVDRTRPKSWTNGGLRKAKTNFNWIPERRQFSLIVLHEFFAQVGCPWAWWWLSSRGWQPSWCPQRGRRRTLPWLLGAQGWRFLGNGGRSWIQWRSHGPIVGTGVFGSTTPWISGIVGSLGEQRFQGGNGVVSWHHRWPERIFSRLWWPTAFVVLFHQWIFGQFALFEPWLIDREF